MLITDKNKLKSFGALCRLWQGIPGIEVTARGSSFITFYSGGTTEEIGNYVLLFRSNDGRRFEELVAAVQLEGHRCYDPCLWIDPLGRLWLIWSVQPDHAVYAAVCDDPDADVVRFGETFSIGHDVMLNKPIVLSSGEWLFPVAVWNTDIHAVSEQYDTKQKLRGSFVYKTVDNGKTFVRLGCADVSQRSFDEHMLLELSDGRILMLVRTSYGIGASYSYDRGKTWSPACDSALGGPCTRFHIQRLRSGRILLINHRDYTYRNNLTAMLSEDEGKTWPYQLLLDERDQVSYPDAKQTEDGFIHIVYDRERGAFSASLDAAYACAREILTAKITEEDIIRGRLVHPQSFVKNVANRLGAYQGNSDRLFAYTNGEIAKRIAPMGKTKALDFLFGAIPTDCTARRRTSVYALDQCIADFNNTAEPGAEQWYALVCAFRSVFHGYNDTQPIVEKIKHAMDENLSGNLDAAALSERLEISRYYMCYLFRKSTGVTLGDYQKAARLYKAKRMLVETGVKITDIALQCGYENASRFTKMFARAEHMSPTQYRHLHKI